MNNFLLRLHQLATEAQEKLSFDGDEGERGYWLEYNGHLAGNFPWIYVDFAIKGSMPLDRIKTLEAQIKELCAAAPGASYLNTTIHQALPSPILRCRLTYLQP